MSVSRIAASVDSAPATSLDRATVREPYLLTHSALADQVSWARVIRHAQCADAGLDPDQWFPVSAEAAKARQEAAAAIAICTTCLVRARCLALSLRHWDVGQYGVWGGLVAAERAQLRRRTQTNLTRGARRKRLRPAAHTPTREGRHMERPRLEYTAELLRHFADLRDGTHGGAISRREKERFFPAAVALLDPHARQSLKEINADLLLGAGEVTATGVRCRRDGLDAIWALSWPEQQAAAIKPVIIRAYYGVGAHHPHLRAGTAATGRSTCSTRSRRRRSCRHCVRWHRPTSTTWSPSVTTASFRPS
jgi:Transcription factor WhiB